MFNKQNGFSIIELLVVISVIVALASISIFSLNAQRAKVRDALRLADISKIRTGLELYLSNEGEYPFVNEAIVLSSKLKLCSKAEGAFVSVDNDCNENTTYISSLQTDPLSNQKFLYTGTREGYDLEFVTEKASLLGESGSYHAHSQVIDQQSGNY